MKATDKISEHITYGEVIRSSYAARNGINNEPNSQQLANITFLCKYVLDRIRDFYERPMNASSIYRCPAVNKGIGGSDTSEHQALGDSAACDFRIAGTSNKQVFDDIRSGKIQGLSFNQLIYEYGETGWIHISTHTDQSRNKHQVLTAKSVNGNTVMKW